MSSSEEIAFKTCRLAHHFGYECGYAPVVTNGKLSTGIGLHACLEAHYQGEPWQDALANYETERKAELEAAGTLALPEVRADFLASRDLIAAMAEGYIEWVKEEGLDDEWETVEVEEKHYITIPDAASILPVKMDLVQRHKETGLLSPVDFKTAASFTVDITKYEMSEQNGNYLLAIMARYEEQPTHMRYRELRKIIPSGRSKPPYFREVPITLTREMLVQRVQNYIDTSHDRFDDDLAVYPNPSSCCGTWKNDWQGPCRLVQQGLTPIEALEASSKYAPKDPYERYDDKDK